VALGLAVGVAVAVGVGESVPVGVGEGVPVGVGVGELVAEVVGEIDGEGDGVAVWGGGVSVGWGGTGVAVGPGGLVGKDEGVGVGTVWLRRPAWTVSSPPLRDTRRMATVTTKASTSSRRSGFLPLKIYLPSRNTIST